MFIIVCIMAAGLCLCLGAVPVVVHDDRQVVPVGDGQPGYPVVVIDLVEVAVAPVGQDRDHLPVARPPGPEPFDGRHHRPRRAAGQDALRRGQRPAAGHGLPVGDGDDLVDLPGTDSGAQQLGAPSRPEAGNVAGPGRPTEDHRAGGVDGHDVQTGKGLPQPAGETEDRAGRAHRHHQAVEGAVEVGQDLAGGAVVVGLPVALVGVLVDPHALRRLPAQLRHPAEPGVEEAAVVVGVGDELDVGAEAAEDAEVGGGGLRVDHTGELQVVDPGGGGQGDAEVSRRALDQVAGGIALATAARVHDDVGGRAVLHAPARVHQLELGDDGRAGRRELAAQHDQRCPADARHH